MPPALSALGPVLAVTPVVAALAAAALLPVTAASPAVPVGATAPPGSAAVAPLRPAVAVPATGFGWPLRPRPVVLRRFAVGPHPWSPGHRGVDLAAPPGADVLAAGGGRVSFAGTVAGVGVVVVNHRALRTTYEPVRGTVPVGAVVARGDRIGLLLPTTGHCATGCLHWGAIRAGGYVDPLSLLGVGPAVLLPLGAP